MHLPSHLAAAAIAAAGRSVIKYVSGNGGDDSDGVRTRVAGRSLRGASMTRRHPLPRFHRSTALPAGVL